VLVSLRILLAFGPPAAVAAAPAADLAEPALYSSLDAPGLAQAEAAAELVRRVNAERERQGMRPLQLADALNASAHVRAAELAERSPLSHERPGGSLQALLAEEGIACTVSGETLARVTAPSPTMAAAKAYDLFIGSEAHRDLLLYPAFTYLGVAISESGGRWLVVQVMTN
jgi:uncharacterized protein YkwD